jgi:hypothetical protein
MIAHIVTMLKSVTLLEWERSEDMVAERKSKTAISVLNSVMLKKRADRLNATPNAWYVT